MIPTHATVSVALTLLSLHPDDIGAWLCPICSQPMELHQPDSGFPERMLWTCVQCATWFLMDIDPLEAQAVLVCLPDRRHFLDAVSDSGRAKPVPPPLSDPQSIGPGSEDTP